MLIIDSAQLDEWLAKKMENLLEDYMKGEVVTDGEMTEAEKLKQIYDERWEVLGVTMSEICPSYMSCVHVLFLISLISQFPLCRTISMELSLLYRGFQTVGMFEKIDSESCVNFIFDTSDTNKDGFLQSSDLFDLCRETNTKLTKEEIDNAMWLMDDNL